MRRLSFVLFLLTARCGESPPVDDAGSPADGPPVATCALRVTPSEPQHMHTSDRMTFTARVVPAMADVELRFALVGEAVDGSLSATRVTPPAGGVATSELTAPSSAASFRVRVSAPCATDAYVDVSVGDRGFGMLLAEAVYRGARLPERLSVGIYRAMDCVSLSMSTPDRSALVPLPGGTARFTELPAGLDYVLRGVALGRDGLELATACAGPVRVDADATARGTLVFLDAPLRLGARYDAAFSFDLSSVARVSSMRWVAPVTQELSRTGGDAALLGYELASAVSMAASPATRDRDRIAFEAAWRDRLAAAVTLQLARREAQITPLFQRLADVTGSVTATVHSSASASASMGDRTLFAVDSVRYVLDPETPDVRGDDVTVPVTTSAQMRVTAGLRDAFTVDITGYALPWNVLARSALGAWLMRQGVSSSAEYVSLSVCPVLVPLARGATGSCDDTCVLAACRRAIATLGTLFDNAITTQDPPRAVVDMRFSGGAQTSAGSLAIDRLSGLATGGFREDTASSIAASALLTSHEGP